MNAGFYTHKEILIWIIPILQIVKKNGCGLRNSKRAFWSPEASFPLPTGASSLPSGFLSPSPLQLSLFPLLYPSPFFFSVPIFLKKLILFFLAEFVGSVSYPNPTISNLFPYQPILDLDLSLYFISHLISNSTLCVRSPRSWVTLLLIIRYMLTLFRSFLGLYCRNIWFFYFAYAWFLLSPLRAFYD